MEIKSEKLPNSQVKLQITLSTKEFAPFSEQAFLRLSDSTDLKGFRPGKAPQNLIRAKIGEDKIFQEALEICLPKTYFEAVKKEKLTPVSDPEIKIDKYDEGKPLAYTAIVDIISEFKLPDYKKIKITKKTVKVGEKELQKSLEDLQKSYAEYEHKKDSAQKGDKIEINFDGYLKSVKVEQLASKNHPLILGQGGFIPGFEDKLVGAKKGETREFELKMPTKLRNQILAGKTINFKVTINEVWDVVLPQIDEKFAQKVAKKPLVEMKKELLASLKKRTELEVDRAAQQEVVTKIAEKTEIEIPRSLVEKEQLHEMHHLREDIESKGLNFADYLSSIGKKESELVSELEKQAQQRIKISLILAKIRDIEKIKVSQKDVDREWEILSRSGYKTEDEEPAKAQIERHLETANVLNFLVDLASK